MSKKTSPKPLQILSPENYIRQKARDLPIYECTISKNWKQGNFGAVSVARKHANGNVTVGLYMVDLNCLGVKDAHYMFNVSEEKYKNTISANGQMDLVPISYELAHNIVYAGLAYAKELGFNPHKDFSVARYILEEDTDEVELIEIECGTNGKPMFVKTEWQTEQEANKIIAQLERSVGKGNYDFIMPYELEDEEDEDEDEFSAMTFEEKKEMLYKLLKSKQKHSNEESKRLHDLIVSVFNILVDNDLVDEYYDEYSDCFGDFEILTLDEIPIEFWGINTDKQSITEEMTTLFVEAYQLVNENTSKASKKTKELKKLVGDIPVVRVLELIICQTDGNGKNSMKMILDNYKTFSEYPFFKLQLFLSYIEKQTIPQVLSETTPSLEFFFGKRTILYEIEFLNYLLLFLALIDNEGNESKLEALFQLIDEMEMPEELNNAVYNTIIATKFKYVMKYFEERKA